MLTEREVSPQLGLLKSTLLQLDSTFSERSYGAGSFRDFVDKLAAIGVLRVHQGKGGWLVAPPDARGPASTAEDRERRRARGAEPARAGAEWPRWIRARRRHRDRRRTACRSSGACSARPTVRRWPMYLRNVKQILRQATPVFDERAYGYATLVDLLRAAQKDGIVRLDRDRQGVVRVFQGQQSPVSVTAAPAEAPFEFDAAAVSDAPTAPTELDEPREAVESDAAR